MATMNDETDAWLKSSDSSDYFALLKMPTIGADPLHLRDCVQATEINLTRQEWYDIYLAAGNQLP